MTYAATVAVHALALLTQFQWRKMNRNNMESSQSYGDIDIVGAQAILTAALIMTTPILNWSTSIRRDKAQVVVVLWGLLIFVAWGPSTVYISSHPDGKPFHPFTYNTIRALLMCPFSVAKENPSCGPHMNVTTDTYEMCQCIDFCGILGPAAPMRNGAKLVPWLTPQSAINRSNSKRYTDIQYFSQTMAAVVVLYGAFGLLHNQFSLREMRNLTFRFFNMHPTEIWTLWNIILRKFFRREVQKSIKSIKDDRKTRFRKVQYQFAKTMAMTFFLLGMMVALACPLTLLAVVITNEYDLSSDVFSEGNDAVGAWSTWVGAALVLAVAVILRYQDAWELFLLGCGDWLLRLFGITTFEKELDAKKNDKSIKKGKIEWFKHFARAFSKELWAPCIHVCHSIRTALSTMMFACGEFHEWIMTTGPHSQICGCEGCDLYRAQLRLDHIDSRPIKARHINIANGCGCYTCYTTRQQRIQKPNLCPCKNCREERNTEMKEKKKREDAGVSVPKEGEEYRTLGIRILQKFDERIRNMLEKSQSIQSQD
jgi:hypothetical protein